jgi:hypothetical protein
MKAFKHTLLLLAILIAHNTFAQTKEETLEWLQINATDLVNCRIEYGSDNKFANVFYIQEISKDSISYIGGAAASSFDFKRKGYKFTVAFKDIIFQDVSTLTMKDSAEKDMGWYSIKTKENKIKRQNLETGKIEYTSDFYMLFKPGNEENAKRVIKAIMHLAKLSGAKENKQTF